MRNEYDFSSGVPFRKLSSYPMQKRKRQGGRVINDDLDRLTPAQNREINRRIKDLKDRTRYLLVSVFVPRFALYYNVSDDCYGMNDARYATLFKRRATAETIKHQLSGNVQMVCCRVNKQGSLVLRSLPKLRLRLPRTRKGDRPGR